MQIFPRSLNRLPALVAVGLAVLGGLLTFVVWYYFSPKHTQVGYAPKQPIPYSHRIHAGQLGIDCRYCHANVERAAHAMIPPTQTCMNCHTQIHTKSGRLEPARASWKDDVPVEWIKIHKLPDHAYFDHRPHVSIGVGCAECHGRIDKMDVVRQDQPLSMSWCLDCHRDPLPRLRPVDQVTNMEWQSTGQTVTPPRQPNPPLNCSGCHR